LAFLLLLTLSEAIYIFNNKPEYFVLYYLKRAKASAENSEAQEAMNFLLKAAKINIRYNAKHYSQLIPSNYDLNFGLPKSNPRLNQAYLDYIQNLNLGSLTRSGEKDLAKIFYTLGLLAYKNNQAGLVSPLWQTAVYLSPELSHLHVELANFYLNLGDRQKAEILLSYCLKFEYPIKHCQEYLDYILSPGEPNEIGFLEGEFNRYYDSLNRGSK